MISIDESCLKCFDNFLNFNASNHFVNKCVNRYQNDFFLNTRKSANVKVTREIFILIVMRVLMFIDRML